MANSHAGWVLFHWEIRRDLDLYKLTQFLFFSMTVLFLCVRE